MVYAPGRQLTFRSILYLNSSATNGVRKIPRERFPEMRIGISLWGDEEDEERPVED